MSMVLMNMPQKIINMPHICCSCAKSHHGRCDRVTWRRCSGSSPTGVTANPLVKRMAGARWRQLATALGLPGEDEADVARHAPRILEHLSLEMEAERSEVVVPEFVTSLGSALQGLLPLGLRVVDPSATIAA